MSKQKRKLMNEMDDSMGFLMSQMRDCAEEDGDDERVAGWNWLIAYERRPLTKRIRDKALMKHRLWYEFSSYMPGGPNQASSRENESKILMATIKADGDPHLLPEYAISRMVGAKFSEGFYVGNHKLSLLMDNAAYEVGRWILAATNPEPKPLFGMLPRKVVKPNE